VCVRMGLETNGGRAREKETININDVIDEGKDNDHTEMNNTSVEKKSRDNNTE